MVDISGSTTIAVTDHPYLRRHVDPGAVRRIWRHARASVLAPLGETGEDPGLVCLGDRDDLGLLLDHVAKTQPPPARVSMPADAVDLLPAEWWVDQWNGWTALSIESVPDVDTSAVVALPLSRWAADISRLLDKSSPQGWGRPGLDDSAWWGVLDAGRGLLAVGAVRTSVAPSAHLSGIATHPSARGCGLGTAVTTALTRAGLAAGQPTVTLDAYSSNTPGLRMYERLGYVVDARFRSGEVLS